MRRGRLQIQAEDPLALRVERACRHEPEALIEAVGTTLGDHVAGEELRRALCADELDDPLHNLATDAASLVALVNDQLPQEPRTYDSGGCGVTSQLSITNPTGSPSR